MFDASVKSSGSIVSSTQLTTSRTYLVGFTLRTNNTNSATLFLINGTSSDGLDVTKQIVNYILEAGSASHSVHVNFTYPIRMDQLYISLSGTNASVTVYYA